MMAYRSIKYIAISAAYRVQMTKIFSRYQQPSKKVTWVNGHGITREMDTSTVLEKYTQDLSNLPLEVKHLMQEIKNKDLHLREVRRKFQSKDSQLQKFIRSNGTLAKHPKEQQMYSKIDEDLTTMKKIQKEKILLANTALFLVSKHLFNLETDIAKLEKDDLLPQIDNLLDGDGAGSDLNSVMNIVSDSISGAGTPRGYSLSASTPETNAGGLMRRPQKRKYTLLLKGASGRGLKRAKPEYLDDRGRESPSARSNEGPNGDDPDNNLYCFCQRVSFGEMIGCDNDDCKYEWFHWSCVGITSPPKDDEVWYCPDCAPKMEKRKKKRK